MLKIYNSSIGVTTRYIGACEGNVNFDIKDLRDLGINTYRLYGGMSRWETKDDDGKYGYPTIAQIKANPNVIPWDKWDAVMNNPASGSDYAFSGRISELWQGSAQTIFEQLKQHHIRPVVTLRNVDPGHNPHWALRLNPPRSQADWNEWWEHVFATVYWLNVRHDYRVDDFEIHNEPDNRSQGWGAKQRDYQKFAQVTSDAIEYVYRKYLPDRTVHIHAPKTVGGSQWPLEFFSQSQSYFNTVNVHNYDRDISGYIKQVRQWMQRTGHQHIPLWIGEWGTYQGGYEDFDFSLNLLKNMVRMSQPGESYVDGSHIFSLYDWGRSGTLRGLVNFKGDHQPAYYAFQMGVRALQGGRKVLFSASSTPKIIMPGVTSIVTQDSQQKLHILLINDRDCTISIKALLPPAYQTSKVHRWEFSAKHQDEMIEAVPVKQGKANIILPAKSSQLLELEPINPRDNTH